MKVAGLEWGGGARVTERGPLVWCRWKDSGCTEWVTTVGTYGELGRGVRPEKERMGLRGGADRANERGSLDYRSKGSGCTGW